MLLLLIMNVNGLCINYNCSNYISCGLVANYLHVLLILPRICFLSDVPNFSDPHIPVVAREILQRMIRQFAAEYTSKTSSPQDSGSESQPCFDQSPALLSGAAPSTSPAGPAHNQNPVLSKLLMADQDAPLDLTIKRPLAVPREQGSVNFNTSVTEQLIHASTSALVKCPTRLN